jgi:hypothetical protein
LYLFSAAKKEFHGELRSQLYFVSFAVHKSEKRDTVMLSFVLCTRILFTVSKTGTHLGGLKSCAAAPPPQIEIKKNIFCRHGNIKTFYVIFSQNQPVRWADN